MSELSLDDHEWHTFVRHLNSMCVPHLVRRETPVAAPPRERQPGALAGHGGSARHKHISDSRNRGKSRAVSRSRQSPPTVDDAAEVDEERDQDEMDAKSCFGVG